MIYGPKRVNDLVNGPKYYDIVLPCWDKNEYSKGNWNCEPPNFGPNHQISAIVFGPQFVRLRNAPKICLVTLKPLEVFSSFTKFPVDMKLHKYP